MSMIQKNSLLLTLILLAVSMSAFADKSDYLWNIQFEKKLTLAQGGDTKAQYDVGNMYMKGQGTDRNAKEAFKWFEKAASKGYERAEYKMGYLYFRGEGDKNATKAYGWLKRAADKGYSPAQFYLGKIYATGNGASLNYETALDWYKKAANDGYYPAKSEVKRLTKLVNEQRREQQAEAEAERNRRIAQAQTRPAAKPAAKPAPKREVVASAAKPSAVARSSRSQTKLDYTEELISNKWVTGTQASLFLPSAATKCKLNNGKLVCVSKEFDRDAEYGIVTYKIETTMDSVNKKGEFAASYRNNVVLVLSNDPDDPNAVIPVKYGWQKPIKMKCKFHKDDIITCQDVNNRRMVFSKLATR